MKMKIKKCLICNDTLYKYDTLDMKYGLCIKCREEKFPNLI